MNRASAITSRSAFERAAHVAAVAATVILVTGRPAPAAPGRPAPAADSAQKAACLRASEEGQRLRVAGRLREARRSFLVCAKDQCPAVVRDDCATWTGDVTDAMASVIFSAHDPTGRPTTAVTVEIDGETVGSHLDGTPLLLDPGDHHLRFAHQGSPAVERTLSLNKGEKRRSVVLDPEAPSAPAPAVAGPTPAPITTTILPPAAPAPPHRSASRLIGPIAFGGAGIVALGVGTYLLVHASSDVSALESSCSPFCGHDAVDRLRTRALTGDILLGIGATSLVAGGYLYFFTQPRAADAPQRSARSFDFTLAPSRDGGRALLQGTF